MPEDPSAARHPDGGEATITNVSHSSGTRTRFLPLSKKKNQKQSGKQLLA
jgi:hypothetical protein